MLAINLSKLTFFDFFQIIKNKASKICGYDGCTPWHAVFSCECRHHSGELATAISMKTIK